MSRFTSASGNSSLCVSALSSPLATARTSIASTDDIGDDTVKSHQRTVMAKIDVSEMFAPLEHRLSARMDAIEAMVEHRCSALEAKVGVLAGTAAGEAAGFQEHLQVLQEQMEQTTASLQAYLLKETSKLSELSEGVRNTIDKQCTLQSNIDDVWRQLKGDRQTLQTSIDDVWQQLKADRQESVAKYRKLSDTVELRLRSLLNKVDVSCSNLGNMLADDITPAHKDMGETPLGTLDLGGMANSTTLSCVAEARSEEGDAAAEQQSALPSLLGARSLSQQTLRTGGPGGLERSSPKLAGRSPSPTVHSVPAGSSGATSDAGAGKQAAPGPSPGAPSRAAANNLQTLQKLQQQNAQGVPRMASVPYDMMKTQQQMPRMTSDSSRGGGYGLRRTAAGPISRSYQQLPQAGAVKGAQSPVLGPR